MEEERELEFEVPRPIRAPGNMAGLTVRGWVLFMSTSLFLGSVAWFLVGWLVDQFIFELTARVAAEIFILGVCYYSFKVDEESGAMGIESILDYLQWRKLDHVVTPKWGDEDDI